jgi:hypothetical protein
VDSGLIGDLGEVLNEYTDPLRDPIHTLVLPVLDGLPDREIARRIRVDHKSIGNLRKGSRPHRAMTEKLWVLAIEVAHARIEGSNPLPVDRPLWPKRKGMPPDNGCSTR